MPDHPPPLADPDAPAEWYPDPESTDLVRWWDGNGWTDDVRPPGDYPHLDWWHPESVRSRCRAAADRFTVGLVARLGTLGIRVLAALRGRHD